MAVMVLVSLGLIAVAGWQAGSLRVGAVVCCGFAALAMAVLLALPLAAQGPRIEPPASGIFGPMPGPRVDPTVPPLKGARTAYMKCTSRSADDWPALNLAVRWDGAQGAIQNPVVVVSAATEKVTRLSEAEKILADSNGDEKTVQRAGEAAVAEVSFLSDAHGSAAYKKELLRVYLARAVRQAQASAA